MRTQLTPKLMSAAFLAGVIATAAVSPASAQTYRAPTGGGLGSVVNCDAPGGKQAGGAVIGALLGAALGSNLAKHDRGTGTAIGAVAGAATGSYVGCKMQRDRQAQEAYGYGSDYETVQPATYMANGLRLSGQISPAGYVRDGGTFVAASTVNLRGAPSTTARRVGQLQKGEPFQALARVRGSDWILVGQGGVGVGYVHGAYVRPSGYQYASYGR